MWGSTSGGDMTATSAAAREVAAAELADMVATGKGAGMDGVGAGFD